MKKSELASQLAEKTGLTKTQANTFLTSLVDVVTGHLANGEKVQLTGLGTWTVRHRKARKGVNPATGEKINIPEKKVASFKASSALASKVS